MRFPSQLKAFAKLRGLTAWLGLLLVCGSRAAGQGLPEPGVILYGAVTNGATGAAVTNGTVALTFTNGVNTVTVSAPITNVAGQFLYVAEVPFETVAAGLTASPTTALPLPGTATSFGRSAKVDGTNAVILDAVGLSFPVANADRGRQLRVNLQLAPSGSGETYEAWSTRFFGVPNADPAADPDGDGRTNLQEYQDGTSPTDAGSVVRVLAVSATGGTVSRAPNQTNFLTGSSVTLTATPQAGFFFTGWSGGVTASTNPLSLVMTQSVAVTASFSALSNAFAPITNALAVNELALFSVTNRATNVTAPTLRFTLAAGAPTGAAVEATNGVLTWTPTEAQGPSSNALAVLVFDTNHPTTFATQQVVALVGEVNLAPVLAAVGNQTVAEGSLLTFTNSATDADLPGNTLTFSLGAGAPSGAAVHPTSGVFAWTPAEGQGPSTNVVSVIVTDNGTPSLTATQTFTVTVTEVNTAPVLAVIGNQTVAELTTLTFTNSATDADLPGNTLTFSLGAGAPIGAVVHPTTGVFTWTPTEAQGPSTNIIRIIVTDSGVPSLSATQTLQVVVTEVNTAPVLAVIGSQTVAELTMVTVNLSAMDADLPANTLTYELVTGPTGMVVNGVSGALTWTPTESQGPSTNIVTVRVVDNGTPSLSATQNFQITVSEVNTAPVLAAVGNQTVAELTTLTFTNVATDTDLPGNTLTFSLGAGAPSGATVHPTTGVFTWTPTEAQGPSTNVVSVVVTDSGAPSLSATQTITVTVTEVNTAPVLAAIGNQTVAEQTTLTVSLNATDADLPANTLTHELMSGPAGLVVNGVSGVLMWTPTEAQGPSTNTVTVRVVDNGTPTLSATQSFQVIVTEVNTSPTLISPATATIKELATLMITNIAVDADLPANGLSFALVSAPVGVSLDASTGLLTWTPTAAQGPSTNNIVLKVTDNGAPALSTTNTITVIVDEKNSAPVLQPIAPQFVTEGSLLVVTNFATDGDIPANLLTFALLSGPVGATLDSVTGVFRWTPGELDGPSTNIVLVKVTDNASPPLSATNSFTVVVSELNTPPALGALATNVFVVSELTTLTITNTASDVDLPGNTLTFSLGTGAPSGAAVHPTSGVFTWTPTEAQGPSTNVLSIIVTDNGVPSLSATQSFQVIVTEVNTAPVLMAVGNRTVAEGSLLTFTNSATDADLPGNTLTFNLGVGAPSGAVVHPTTGVFTWTPTEGQGPSTNVVSVIVTDNGAPSLTATQSFQVIVTEVNSAPVLAAVGNLVGQVGVALSHALSASDSDLPANQLSYELLTGPAGMLVGSANGSLSWTPQPIHSGSSNWVTVRVIDNGNPPLSSTQSFAVAVTVLPLPTILSLQPTNQLFIGRTNSTNTWPATFTITASNATSFQWSFSGAPISGATNPTFSIADSRRTNSGIYTVSVVGPGGTVTTNAVLHVAVPQRIRTVHRLADGTVRLWFNDEDGVVAVDPSRLKVKVTSSLPRNFVNWTNLAGSIVHSNGMLLFQDVSAPGNPRRFYQIIEEP